MYLHRTALLMIVGIYLLAPLVVDWWLQPGSSWYRPFVIWMALIVLSWLVDLRRSQQDV